jgi:hypothetical protein
LSTFKKIYKVCWQTNPAMFLKQNKANLFLKKKTKPSRRFQQKAAYVVFVFCYAFLYLFAKFAKKRHGFD